jgi:hypothetical protein
MTHVLEFITSNKPEGSSSNGDKVNEARMEFCNFLRERLDYVLSNYFLSCFLEGRRFLCMVCERYGYLL